MPETRLRRARRGYEGYVYQPPTGDPWQWLVDDGARSSAIRRESEAQLVRRLDATIHRDEDDAESD